MCIALTLLLVCFTAETGPGRSPQFTGAYSPPAAKSSEGMQNHRGSTEHHVGCSAALPDLCAALSPAVQSAAAGYSSSSRSKAEGRGGVGSQAGKGQHSGEPSEVSKDDIRRALAFVSACYVHARPSRGALRQVYNFLLQADQ